MSRDQFSIPAHQFRAFCSHVTSKAGIAAGATLLILGACSSNNGNNSGYSVVPQDHAVGTTSMTFVAASRPTAAHGSIPEAPTRTIVTSINYSQDYSS